jgi:hypothetical protein
VGDEAARIARTVQRLMDSGVSSRMRLPVSDVSFEASLATALLRRALDAFARLDVNQALQVIKQDNEIDVEFEGLMRKLITYMMEDPRTISASIDLVFVAKAIERVGDHAKNLAEQIIYIVKGTDVRHNSLDRWSRSRFAERYAPAQDAPAMSSACLVVEDEAAIAELIAINLRHAGLPRWCWPAECGEDGPGARWTAVLPDLILLDWMLPGQQRPVHAGETQWRADRRARGSCRSSCSRRAADEKATRSRWAWTRAPTTT